MTTITTERRVSRIILGHDAPGIYVRPVHLDRQRLHAARLSHDLGIPVVEVRKYVSAGRPESAILLDSYVKGRADASGTMLFLSLAHQSYKAGQRLFCIVDDFAQVDARLIRQDEYHNTLIKSTPPGYDFRIHRVRYVNGQMQLDVVWTVSKTQGGSQS